MILRRKSFFKKYFFYSLARNFELVNFCECFYIAFLIYLFLKQISTVFFLPNLLVWLKVWEKILMLFVFLILELWLLKTEKGYNMHTLSLFFYYKQKLLEKYLALANLKNNIFSTINVHKCDTFSIIGIIFQIAYCERVS